MGEASRRKGHVRAVRFMDCGEAQDAVIVETNGHSGPGWYVYCSEYPEDGAEFLGRNVDPAKLLARARSALEVK